MVHAKLEAIVSFSDENSSMPSFALHCIRFWSRVAPIFVLAGCWEKIEYSAPKVSPAQPGVLQEATDAAPINNSTTIARSASADKSVDRGATSAASPPPAAPANSPPTQPPAERYAVATPASATMEVAPAKPLPNTRREAWILGSRISLAALAHDRGMAPENVPKWLGEARSAADVLGTSVPDLPERTMVDNKVPVSQQVLDYLGVQYQRIVRELGQKHGLEHAALFEVALKSNILILLYSPGSSEAGSLSTAISRAAPQAQLPAELWKPLSDLLGKQSSLNDVRTAVRQMHKDVDQYLANAAEQSGR
jgi:hypothetical protein